MTYTIANADIMARLKLMEEARLSFSHNRQKDLSEMAAEMARPIIRTAKKWEFDQRRPKNTLVEVKRRRNTK